MSEVINALPKTIFICKQYNQFLTAVKHIDITEVYILLS
jgi:hypothetical protein